MKPSDPNDKTKVTSKSPGSRPSQNNTEQLADEQFRPQEIIDRIEYRYLRFDGTIEFPNSYDGDVLRIAYKTAKATQAHIKEEVRKALGSVRDATAYNYGTDGELTGGSYIFTEEQRSLINDYIKEFNQPSGTTGGGLEEAQHAE